MQLDYSTYGKGQQAIVVLHGLLGSRRNWMGIAKTLAPNYRVILFDLRNHGRSPWDDDCSLKAMATDVIESVNKLKLARPFVVGHSLGGKVAMRAALDHPEQLRAITVVDIAPRQYPNHLMHDLEAMLSLNLSMLKTRRDADLALATQVPDPFHRNFLLTNLRREDDGSLTWATNLRGLYQGMDALRDSPLGLRDRIGVPSLFLFGERSTYVQDTDVPLVKRHFRDVDIRWVSRAGHNVHSDQPQAVVNALAEFFAAHSRA